jgi:hypothetical protein
VKGSVEHNYEPVDKRWAKEILENWKSNQTNVRTKYSIGPNENDIIAQWTQNLLVRIHLTIYYRG